VVDPPVSSITTVAADRSTVLAVLTDFPAYPKWASGMKSVEVLTSNGARAETVRFSIDAGPIKDSYVVGYEWDEDTVRFTLVEPGNVVSALTGMYGLTDVDGGTDVSYELATELKMPMMGMFRKKMENMIIKNTLKDLRRRIEQT
jgi:carbon monoxide dehydrogenase subunit G